MLVIDTTGALIFVTVGLGLTELLVGGAGEETDVGTIGAFKRKFFNATGRIGGRVNPLLLY